MAGWACFRIMRLVVSRRPSLTLRSKVLRARLTPATVAKSPEAAEGPFLKGGRDRAGLGELMPAPVPLPAPPPLSSALAKRREEAAAAPRSCTAWPVCEDGRGGEYRV